MSLNVHKYSVALDNAIAKAMETCNNDIVTGRKLISVVTAAQIVQGLSLPTAEVSGVDQYWWSSHHELVTKQVSAVNEVYPIPVLQVVALVKELYVRRYNAAYPRSVHDFCTLLYGEFSDGSESLVSGTRGMDHMFHNLTVAEILRDAIK